MRMATLSIDGDNTLLLEGGRIRIVFTRRKGNEIRLGVIGDVSFERARTPTIDGNAHKSVELSPLPRGHLRPSTPTYGDSHAQESPS